MYFMRKTFAMIITVFLVSIITFFAFELIPGDPVLAKLGINADQAQIEALREELNINKPLAGRYISWVSGIFTGDMGKSIRYDMDVNDIIGQRFSVTFQLSIMSIIIIIIFGIPLGILAAKYDDNIFGFLISFITQIGLAIPSFWAGILLIYLFGLILNLFTAGGYVSWSQNPLESIKSLFLPALAIAIPNIAVVIRYLKSSILEEKDKDYTKTALAKGLSSNQVLIFHILRNAIIPVITILAMIIAKVLAGSIVIEQVFTIPGMGRLLINAISTRDLPLVQGLVFYISIIVVMINFLVDIVYKFIDPRIKLD
ncbi:peptide/nickel transport system permease protein [Oceanotoga teriensis]|uniref:Peptide/nickel transport system permease protein n=1 Tax=Oceanotoga teriensis TaxID=515440 RepID=A0AA45C5S2_9BACT|nr:ABC transporter permease [Oceanotoga teriensis]PWJ89336.1 peptide/nickel transport system permease protein [Oceanotoga teriensis]